jgi:hypothetical protein
MIRHQIQFLYKLCNVNPLFGNDHDICKYTPAITKYWLCKQGCLHDDAIIFIRHDKNANKGQKIEFYCSSMCESNVL